MSKGGDTIVIRPAPKRSLLALLKTLQPLDDALSPIDDPLPEPVTP